jgi:hypothetical protein
MSDDVKLVKAQREAFVEGVKWADVPESASRMREVAARLYPLPTVTVPRVLRSNEDQYRLANGCLQHRTSDHEPWTNAPRIMERTHAINQLLANPTETREVTE